jgi:hypothetical protein
MKKFICAGFIIGIFLLCKIPAQAQFLMDMIDTTKELGKSTFQTIDRFNHIRISGYIQPQYQIASEKGAKGYSGGNFEPNSDNRFMIRRGRLRFDYMRTDELHRNQIQFVFQFDGTERGVFIRDFWGRYWENKWQLLAFTGGMFARPFGFEVNLSSSDRESPERGRMSQILMKTERDLGFMTTLEKRGQSSGFKFFRMDLGVFNGQGLTASGEYDSFKDIIGQFVLKPQKLTEKLTLGAGASFLYGGLEQTSKYSYRLSEGKGDNIFIKDSVTSTVGSKLPRQYYGLNAQLRYKTKWGNTELRAEYWQGTQTGTQISSETPSSIIGAAPMYVRPFQGGFLYFLQHIVNVRNQIGLKFDWYDPNTAIAGEYIGSPGTNFSDADIKYSTLGCGYIRYINENMKLVLWYEWVKNESTSLSGFTTDKSDNVFTARVQFRF